jgi:hypothetical protein
MRVAYYNMCQVSTMAERASSVDVSIVPVVSGNSIAVERDRLRPAGDVVLERGEGRPVRAGSDVESAPMPTVIIHQVVRPLPPGEGNG